nr:hypothetical protein [Nocardia ninae]
MRMAILWCAAPGFSVVGQRVGFDDRDSHTVLGQHVGGEQSSESAAEDEAMTDFR